MGIICGKIMGIAKKNNAQVYERNGLTLVTDYDNYVAILMHNGCS